MTCRISGTMNYILSSRIMGMIHDTTDSNTSSLSLLPVDIAIAVVLPIVSYEIMYGMITQQ